MRVAPGMRAPNSLRRLWTRLERHEDAQSQLADGERVRRPSDDPARTARALSLRASERSRKQEGRNAADARSWLDLTDTQLQAAVERLQRARALAVRGSSSLEPTERTALASEITAVHGELVVIANFRDRGQALFSGFSHVDAVARDADGTWQYRGDDGRIERRVGEHDVVGVNVTAREAFGFGTPGGDVFSLLDDLVTALETAGRDEATALLDRLDDALNRIGHVQGRVAASANRVDSAQRRADDALLLIRHQLAEVEDTEIAGVILELQTQEMVLQATLQALARAFPSSLVNFLR